jgi:hypothetical protein
MESSCPCQTNWRTGEYHLSECLEAKKLRDSWCTPADVAELLPMVDLDPATNIRSLIKAKRSIVWDESPRSEDQYVKVYTDEFGGGYRTGEADTVFYPGNGLTIPWNGSIFFNGPYSDMLPWCQKANEEWAEGRLTEAIFLVKLDPTTKWWRELTGTIRYDDGTLAGKQRSVDLWLPHKRLQHIPPPRIRSSTNNFASAIIHWRDYYKPRTQPKLDALHKIARLWT